MKKTALFAAAAALMAASPAAANGYLGLEYGTGSIDLGGPDSDSELWQGEGAFGFGGSGGWGGQIDGSVGNIEFDAGGDADVYTLAGHLWFGGSGWRLGGVIATANLDDGTTEVEDFVYGIEGTYDFGPNTVLISSLTTGESETSGADADTWNWDAGVNFYPSPNIRIGGFFGVGNVDSGVDADTTSFGINGEFQPWSAPVSITLGWNSFEIDDIDLNSDAFTIGARWNFGGGTVRDRDNSTPFDTNTGFASRLYGVW